MQSSQAEDRILVVVDQHGFRQLQFQPVRREAGGADGFEQLADKLPAPQMPEGKRGGDRDAIRPAGCVPAGVLQYPAADAGDDIGMLGDGHEMAGGDKATAVMPEPEERFRAADEAGA